MHFYMRLVTVLFPYVILNEDNQPPSGEKFVVDYTGTQVVTYNNDILIADEA